MKAVIGALRAVLGMDTVAFEEGIGRARKEMSGFNRTMQAAARDLEKVGRTMTAAITAPLAAFGALSLRSAANFEEGMGRVQAATGATAKEFEALTAKAREIGATTQFSASEAASAIEALAKNGLNVTQIMAGAADATVALAAANGAQLAPAADVVTDVMNQFGIKAEQLGSVIDTVTGTLVASKFGFDDYRLAIGQAGGVAGKVGVSFEDFNAALALTSSSFASGSDAGTSFKTFLTKMVPVSDDAARTMKSLGLSFFDSTGNMVTMEEAARRLQTAFKGLNDTSRIGAATKIFGTDSMRTALALADAGAEGIRRMQAEIAKVSATDQAAVRMKGFNGALRELRAAVEALQIAIGNSGLLQWATDLVKALSSLIQRLAAVNPELLKWGTIAGGVAAAMGPLALAAGVLTSGLGKLLLTVVRLAPAMAPLLVALGPLAGTAGLLALAAGGAVLFADKIALSRDGVVTLADALTVAGAGLRSLKADLASLVTLPELDFAAWIGGGLKRAFDDVINQTVGDFARSTAKEMDLVYGVLSGAMAAIASSWSTSWEVLNEVAAAAIGKVRERIAEWVRTVVEGINWLREKIGKDPLPLPPLAPWEASGKSAFREAGQAMADAWNRGFQQTFFSDQVQRAIDAARDAALLRGAKPFNPFPESGTPSIPPPAPKPLGTGGGGGGRNLNLGGGGSANQLETALKRIEEERKALEAATAFLKTATGVSEAEIFRAADELARIGSKTAALLKDQDANSETAKRIRDQVTALEEARTANQAYTESLRLAFQVEAQYGNGKMVLAETQRQLNAALATGKLSQDAYAIAMKNAADAARQQDLAARGAKGGLDGFMAGIESAADAMSQRASAFELGKQAFGEVSSAATQMVDAIFEGDKNLGDILSSMLKRLASFAMEALIMKPLFDSVAGMVGGIGGGGGGNSFGGQMAFAGSGGGGGGLLGSIVSGIGSFFGGFFADGGRVTPGKWYMTGEEGPEPFIPDTAGTILPNDALSSMGGGSPNVTQNINIMPDVAAVTRATILGMKPQIAQWGADGAYAKRRQGGRFADGFKSR
jgi:TP901 family phage tail tape measure protein